MMFPNYRQGGNAKQPKYKNKKCEFQGKKFDSIIERDRYIFLKDQEDKGNIVRLTLQDKWPITINGEMICNYISDFCYGHVTDKGTVMIVEDVKGFAITAAYRLKEKMVKAFYSFEIQIVTKATAPIGIQAPKLRKKSKPKTTKRKLEL